MTYASQTPQVRPIRRARAVWRALAIVATLTLLALPSYAADADRIEVQSIGVEIAIGGDGAIDVHEHYRFAKAVRLDFRYLTGPCSDISPGLVAITTTVAADYTRTRSGPWILLHAPANLVGASEYWVSYTVSCRTRTANIPIVLPSYALEPATGTTMNIVGIHVLFSRDSAGSVVLPQMQSDGRGGNWSTAMSAMPSFVRVRCPSPALPEGCPGPAQLGDNGSSGSIEGWFLAFAASLVVWIALYMYWANRQERGSKGASNL
jgi:hypothetical protein